MAKVTRRTIEIATLIAEVNRRNRESTCAADIRQGWNSLLESVLHNADVYAGFGYYTHAEVPIGAEPGIRTDEAGGKTFPDETRRYYYVDHKVTYPPRTTLVAKV